MRKKFNTTGICRPGIHYMVDLGSRLKEIAALVEAGEYFAVNRPRQYGKTTILHALAGYLRPQYGVISLDFQMLSHADFENEAAFVSACAREILAVSSIVNEVPADVQGRLETCARASADDNNVKLAELSACLSLWCACAGKPLVLIIDEADSAQNNQVFLDFLSQLRGYYMHREERAAFRSVILAGVYDIRNLKQKIRPSVGNSFMDEGHKQNSPWNIAAEFKVDMHFCAAQIAGMLEEYERDCGTGMDTREISALIYAYTSGYPFLVSRLCKIMDEELPRMHAARTERGAWSREGFFAALNLLLAEKNTLFESMTGKLSDYPGLRGMVYQLLFNGREIPYNALIESIRTAEMFGFIKKEQGSAVISNRIFETVFYNQFLFEEAAGNKIYDAALQDKNQFVENGRLNMELVLRKFVTAFDDLYGNQNDEFVEEAGRRYFLLFLKPIINGTGSIYVEAQTRNMRRTDVVVDYGGEQFIIELKIWHGSEYNRRGEKQLLDYLDSYHLKKGYLLSYNFNKNKQIGVREIRIGDKTLVEAVV